MMFFYEVTDEEGVIVDRLIEFDALGFADALPTILDHAILATQEDEQPEEDRQRSVAIWRVADPRPSDFLSDRVQVRCFEYLGAQPIRVPARSGAAQ